MHLPYKALLLDHPETNWHINEQQQQQQVQESNLVK